MPDERVVVEIGFDGGQIMGARLTSASADELEQALATRTDGALMLDADALERALAGGEDGSVALEASDGRYVVQLRRVVYVKRFVRESRVGFGAD